jgi:sacsin
MCPPPVLAFFENRKKVTSIDLITILSFLDNVGGDTLQRFCQSHDEEYAKFAEWARAGVRDMPKRLLAPACRLPIWPNLCTGGTVSYVTAAAARVLPFKATPSIAMPFVSFESNIVAYSPALVNHLHVRPMGFSIFRDCLTIPSRLSEGNTHDYRRLLDLLISSRLEDPRDVVVPNALGSMVPSSTLYSRLNTLFLQAFQTRPEKLIHADFRHLESGLSGFGLKTQMSFASFKVCVTAIHEDVDGENRVQRARSLFSWYNNELPIHTAGDYTSWRELDNLRFIPRHEIRHRTMSLYMDTYARTLPDLVAPNEIVRPEFEAIAWTQRALFQQRPSERLLIADLSLGVPSVFEVVRLSLGIGSEKPKANWNFTKVEHLRILAKRISPNFPSDVDILSDITKTYEWLESHKNDPHLRCLEQYKKECLFLNVDDAQSTEWRWHCAEQMFFCLRAPDPDNRFFGVGAFLSPFQGLLRCAGVKEIKNPARPKLTISSPESQLSQIRTNFNDMRNEGMLTDVVFTSDDDKQFPAHRVLLATQTDYFRDQFSKNWDTGSVARDTHAIRMVGYNGSTLEVTLGREVHSVQFD